MQRGNICCCLRSAQILQCQASLSAIAVKNPQAPRTEPANSSLETLAGLESLLSLCEFQATRSGVPLLLRCTGTGRRSQLRDLQPARHWCPARFVRQPSRRDAGSEFHPQSHETRLETSGIYGWKVLSQDSFTDFILPDHTSCLRDTASMSIRSFPHDSFSARIERFLPDPPDQAADDLAVFTITARMVGNG